MFIVQVAAVSCAATHVPEINTANQSFRYSGFRNAAKVDVLLALWFTDVVTGPKLELLKNQTGLYLESPGLDRPQAFPVGAGAKAQQRRLIFCEPIQSNAAKISGSFIV
jgi:hypothetical protein